MTRLKTIRRKYRKKYSEKGRFRDALRNTAAAGAAMVGSAFGSAYGESPKPVSSPMVRQVDSPAQEFLKRNKLTVDDRGVLQGPGIAGKPFSAAQALRRQYANLLEKEGVGSGGVDRGGGVGISTAPAKPVAKPSPQVNEVPSSYSNAGQPKPRTAQQMYGGRSLKSLRLKYRSKKKKEPHGEPHENAAAIRSDVQERKKKERTRQRSLEGPWHDKRRGWPHDPTERK